MVYQPSCSLFSWTILLIKRLILGSVHIVQLLLLLVNIWCILLMIEDHFLFSIPLEVVFGAAGEGEDDEEAGEGASEDDDDSNVFGLVTSARFLLLDRVDQAHLQVTCPVFLVNSVDLSSGPGANLPVHCLRSDS